jgi:hypothetical protein
MLASIQGTDASTMGMVTNDPVARQRDPKLYDAIFVMLLYDSLTGCLL